jgi:hypothetical protein
MILGLEKNSDTGVKKQIHEGTTIISYGGNAILSINKLSYKYNHYVLWVNQIFVIGVCGVQEMYSVFPEQWFMVT